MFDFNTRHRRSASSPSALGAGLVAASGTAKAWAQAVTRGRSGTTDAHAQPGSEAQDLLTPNKTGLPSVTSPGTSKYSAAPAGPKRAEQAGVRLTQPQRASLQRSATAPELSGRLGPMLGVVGGAPTTQSTKQLLVALLHAQTMASCGPPAEQVAAHFDVATLRHALLRRDLKQEGAIEALAATPVERVFESVLAEELIHHMPAPLLQPMEHLAHWTAHALGHLDAQRSERVMKGFLADLRREHPRPWSGQAPILTRLCDHDEPWPNKKAALTEFLAGPLASGVDGLTAMVLLRSSFLAYKTAGLDTTLAPWLKDSDLSYQAHILPRKPGKPHAVAQAATDQMAGITNLGQPSPLRADHLVSGVRATYRDAINLDSQDAQEAIAYGNPVAAGLSGTTNIFLHAASFFNQTQNEQQIDGPALTTLLAALTCYNGGHSIHEVFSIGHLLQGLAGLNMDAFAGFSPGHARGMFVDLATRHGAQNLTEVSFERLEAHFREHPLDAT